MCLAIPGKICSIYPATDELFRSGKVSFGGIQKEVNLSLVPQANVGDYVLVHVGIAIQVVDEAQAMTTFEYLEVSGETEELYSQAPE
jgi:hydrogenase expression/formation protein HypC